MDMRSKDGCTIVEVKYADPSSDSVRQIKSYVEAVFFSPEPKRPPARRRPIPARFQRRWVDDLMDWCWDRGLDTDDKIGGYLGVRRETLIRWRSGGNIGRKSSAVIRRKTQGDIDPERRR